MKLKDVITHPVHNFNGDLTKITLKLGTDDWIHPTKQKMYPSIYDLISVNLCQETGPCSH